MSYITRTLGEDEKVQVVAKLHWICYVYPTLLLCLCLFCGLLGLGANPVFLLISFLIGLLAFYHFLNLNAIEMVVTNRRVVCRKGIIGIKTWELKNNKVESIEVKQSLKGRILGYATLWFSGTGTSKVCFQNIKNPWSLKKKIDLIIGKDED